MRHCKNFKGNLTSEQVHRNNKLKNTMHEHAVGFLFPLEDLYLSGGAFLPQIFLLQKHQSNLCTFPVTFLRYTLRASDFPLESIDPFAGLQHFQKIEEPSKTRLDFRTCGQYWLVQICGLQNRVPVRPIDFLHLAKWLGYNKFSWFTTLNSRNVVLFLP